MIGSVSADSAGDFLLRVVEEEGIDPAQVARVDGLVCLHGDLRPRRVRVSERASGWGERDGDVPDQGRRGSVIREHVGG